MLRHACAWGQLDSKHACYNELDILACRAAISVSQGIFHLEATDKVLRHAVVVLCLIQQLCLETAVLGAGIIAAC